jgi:hypothetical protein
MTQSQCFDAAIHRTSFLEHSTHEVSHTPYKGVEYAPLASQTYYITPTNKECESSTSRPSATRRDSAYRMIKLMAFVLTVVFLIFNLPFILTIGYDMLLTVVLLFVSPVLFQTRYGILLHITAIWSLIYALRTMIQPHLNPFYYIASLFISMDQIYIAISDIERNNWQAVSCTCSVIVAVMVLILGDNASLSWRPYVDALWLAQLCMVVWHT